MEKKIEEDFHKYPKSQHVFITQSLSGISSFEKDINIDFNPEKVIVRSIAYANDGQEQKLFYVWANLVNSIIASPYDSVYRSLHTTFKLYGKGVRGRYKFTINNVDGSVATRSGDLCIHLEFIG